MEAFAWPAVVLILGLFALFLQRKPLGRLIDRTQKVGKGGLEAGEAIQTAAPQTPKPETEEALELLDDSLLALREADIVSHLNKLGVTDPAEREHQLIRYLAGCWLSSTFDRVYMSIWGSQIGALQILNTAGPAGVEFDVVEEMFEDAAVREPKLYKGDTVERWLGFLEASGLVTREGELVRITVEGREFLKHLVQEGYSPYKRG